MIRILKISNPKLESNLRYIEKMKEIIRFQFQAVSEDKIEILERQMMDPVSSKFQSILFIALDFRESVTGFALLLFMSDLKFCFLDYIAVSPKKSSSGIGGALYDRVRDEAISLKAFGVFFECLPDDPSLCGDNSVIPQNKKRLAFYENFGARPISNTLYETKVNPQDDCPPYLVFDGLGKNDSIPNKMARKVVHAILLRKYGDYCPAEYTERVLSSIKDDPVVLRPFRYKKLAFGHFQEDGIPLKNKILLVVNDQHFIHHVKERGYVESPVRIANIKKSLDQTLLFETELSRKFPDKFILDVHDKGYYNYFKKVCEGLPKGKSVYPYVFPFRNAARAPKELSVRAGYYCFDTFTPLNKNAFLAAREGVDCTLTAADSLIYGKKAAYVLTRPPGHHVEKAMFGGFSYFNNVAIAAHYLSKVGKIAILDIDYHHGNGQQQIFYERDDVLTISLHGDPSFAYPYFSGFREETGIGIGEGFNFNFPLPEKLDYVHYEKLLIRCLKSVKAHKPVFLIVALGFDTAKGDPTGTWDFNAENFKTTGKIVGDTSFPTLIVQEGGYKNQSIGNNARNFFEGFYESHYGHDG